MEYSLFSNCVPVGNFNTQFYHSCSSPRLSSSDSSSMDTDLRDSMKLKDANEDDFFSWSNEMRVPLDDERTAYQMNETNQLCVEEHKTESAEDQCNQREQDPCKGQEFHEDEKSSGYLKQKYMKGVAHIGKNKEEQYRKMNVEAANKMVKMKKMSDISTKAEMDVYLDKSQLNMARNHMSCNGESPDSNHQENGVDGIPRKRKLEGGWQNHKIRPSIPRDMVVPGRMLHVDDIEIELPNDFSNNAYNMSEAILSLPVFKQEVPSPTNGHREQNNATKNAPWLTRQPMMMNNTNNNNNTMNNNNVTYVPNQHSPIMNQLANNNINNNNNNGSQQVLTDNGNHQSAQLPLHSNATSMVNTQTMPVISSVTSYNNGLQDAMNTNSSTQNVMDMANGLLCSQQPVESFGSNYEFDNRFQYILAAATSIATKCNEDSLTYLNQNQSYEIKLKKLGDLSNCRGKILKSIIRLCFHERRLQFAEREQMSLWQNERPGERIVEVDVPLSYGLIHINQPIEQTLLNTVEVYWDPVKECGVYVKVNCISTEFTAKKHGGEKGVPFRIQIETFLPGEGVPGTTPKPLNQSPIPDKRLHAAACQIKVFKLKGADRKHKQDREKLWKKPPHERDKYHPKFECTVFTELPNDAVFSPVVGVQSYSPEYCSNSLSIPMRPIASSSVSPPRLMETTAHTSGVNTLEMKYPRLSRADSHGSSLDCDEDVVSRSILRGGGPGSPCDRSDTDVLTEVATPLETRAWLTNHRFLGCIQTFGNYSGGDLLRSSRDDLIQICGLADGIRLYNALHAERAPARVTLYFIKMTEQQYHAVYLRRCAANELKRKIHSILQLDGNANQFGDIFVAGPCGIKIRITDEVVQNLKNDAIFRLESTDGGFIMIPTSV